MASAQWMSSITRSSGCATAARADEVDDRVEHPQAGAATFRGRGDLTVEQRRQQRVQLGRFLVTGQRADDAQPWPQRRGVVTFVAASDEHPEAGRRGVVGEVVHQPRLADPRFAGDQQEPGRARRPCVLEHRDGPVEEWLPSDRPGRVPPHPRCRRRRRCGRRGRPFGCDRRQHGVLAEHRLLEPLDLFRGVDAELLGQSLTKPSKCLERVGLPRALVLREREQRPQPLAVGMPGCQLGQRALGIVGSPQVEQCPRPLLLQSQEQLLEPTGLGHHERRVAVGVRRARPERACLVAQRQPLARAGGRQRSLGPRLEPPHVDVVDLGHK